MPTRRKVLQTASALSALPATASAVALDQADPVEKIRVLIDRYAAAWAGGDSAGAIACYHDDFTLHYFGRNALSGDHVGKAAALQALGQMRARTQWRVKSITTTMAGPGHAAIAAKVAYALGGETVEMDRVLIFAVLDDRLRECWAYDQDQRRLDEIIGGSA